MDLERTGRLLSSLEEKIYSEILYRAKHAENRRRGVRGIHYLLIQPDSWMIALGYIMWEGLVQGMTWEIVKGLVLSGLDQLRSRNVAPNEDINRETEIEFHWDKYAKEMGGRRF